MPLFVRALVAAVAILAGWPALAYAEGEPRFESRATPTARASRLVGDIHIDGQLDEAVWGHAVAHDGFVQRSPEDGAQATEPTTFRVLYDDSFLYIGVDAIDSSPELIEAYLSRRDTWTPSDWIHVGVGAHNDGRSAYEYAINPAGVRRDGRWHDDTTFDSTWDSVWQGAAHIHERGWSVEMAIPLSQLRFDDSHDEATWDLQVRRTVARKNESVYWSYAPLDEAGHVSHYGEVSGLVGVKAQHQLELLPYAMAGLGVHEAEADNPFRPGQEALWGLGGDITYGLSSDLTLAASVNPDFGQLEADPAEINLSAFESYHSERRPFFQEGANLFTIDGPDFFYSRRVGRRPQHEPNSDAPYREVPQQTTILGAARLTGKTGPWSIGVLDALTSPEFARTADDSGAGEDELVEPLTNYFVGRLRRDLRGGRTVVGGMVTSTSRRLEGIDDLHAHATSGALDWDHRWADNAWRLSGYTGFSHVGGSAEAIAATQESSARYYQRPDAEHLRVDPTRTSLTGFAGNLTLAKESGSWIGDTWVSTMSPGFEINDIGYQTRVDYTQTGASIRYRDLEAAELLRSWDVRLRSNATWSYGAEHTGLWMGVDGNLQTANYWGGWWGAGYQPGALCTRCTRGGPALTTGRGIDSWMGVYTDSRKAVSGQLSGWYWRELWTGSSSFGIDPFVTIRPTRFIDVDLGAGLDVELDDWQWVTESDGRYVFADIVRYGLSLTLRANLTITPDLTLQGYLQPFLASGRYVDFIELVAPRAESYGEQFDELPTRSRADGEILVGDTNGLTLEDPDFRSTQLNSNVVLRWEYMPGSTLFAVWQLHSSADVSQGDFDLGKGLEELFGADASTEHTVMVKANYWWSL